MLQVERRPSRFHSGVYFFIFLDFYSAVRQKWVNHANKLRNVTVLSVGGGHRDYQVRSGLTSLPSPPGDPNKLSLVVTAVPRTWVSTDHLSIVW